MQYTYVLLHMHIQLFELSKNFPEVTSKFPLKRVGLTDWTCFLVNQDGPKLSKYVTSMSKNLGCSLMCIWNKFHYSLVKQALPLGPPSCINNSCYSLTLLCGLNMISSPYLIFSNFFILCKNKHYCIF